MKLEKIKKKSKKIKYKKSVLNQVKNYDILSNILDN